MSESPDPHLPFDHLEPPTAHGPADSDVIDGFASIDPSLSIDLVGAPPGDLPNGFNAAFRLEIARVIFDVLNKGYDTQRVYVAKEARKRNLSVEHLLAGYLARRIMDKVDREYV